MLRSTRLAMLLGLLMGLAVPAIASADIWSIQSDCEDGDWSVSVTLDGLGTFDASCLDGTKTEQTFDSGALVVTGVEIEATSALGTYCQVPSSGDSKIVLKCASKSEISPELETEDEVEVEIEWEEADPGEDETDED